MLCYAKSLQSCLTLCDPIDGSPPGSPVPGILQARTLEWVAISFSNAWKWKVKVKSLSRVRPSATPWTADLQAPPSMGFSRQEYWSGVPLPSPFKTIGELVLYLEDSFLVSSRLIYLLSWPLTSILSAGTLGVYPLTLLPALLPTSLSLSGWFHLLSALSGLLFAQLWWGPGETVWGWPMPSFCLPHPKRRVSIHGPCCCLILILTSLFFPAPPSSHLWAGRLPDLTMLSSGLNDQRHLLPHACVCSSVWFCSPTDCSPSSLFVHGILQTKILEWVAISSSRSSFPTQGSNPCLLWQMHWQADSFTTWATWEVLASDTKLST